MVFANSTGPKFNFGKSLNILTYLVLGFKTTALLDWLGAGGGMLVIIFKPFNPGSDEA